MYREHARLLFTLDKVIERFWWTNLVMMIKKHTGDRQMKQSHASEDRGQLFNEETDINQKKIGVLFCFVLLMKVIMSLGFWD